MENMFAGVPQVGAEEGWYLTQIAFETFRLQGKSITAGSIDVYKCFDQINRKLIYRLAKEAGMPKQILGTYRQYIDNLDIRSKLEKRWENHTETYALFPKGARSP